MLGDADLDGSPRCPYRGLRPYTERDGDYFFGRDRDRELVIANLMASRVTVLYGPSGVGKSSLLGAGVLRQLRRLSDGAFGYLAVGHAIAVYHKSWRDRPLIGLADAVRAAIPPELSNDDLVPAHVPLSVELLRHLTERLDADVYLLCDQFEEAAFYQKGAAGEAFAAEFGRIISAPALRVSVLIGIREDALAKLDRFEAHASAPFTNRLRLRHLDEAAARDAIEQPLHRYSACLPPGEAVTNDPSLVEELLRELRTGRVEGHVGRGSGDDASAGIETPFLQLVMTRLWFEERARGSRVLRLSTLAELGGAELIVRKHLDRVMDQLTEPQRDVAAKIFRCLVTRSGMKMAYTAEDLADFASITDRGLLAGVLERLTAGQERVLVPVPPRLDESGSPRYEVSHDVMAEAVLEWQRGYTAARERRALERHLRQVALAALAVIALLSVAIWAQGRSLQSQRRLALSRQLVTVANALVSKQTDTAVLLHLHSMSLARHEERQPPAGLVNALTRLQHPSRRFTEPSDVRDVAVSRTGVLATALGDGEVALRNLRSGRELGRWRTGSVTAVAFTADGRLLATGRADGRVRLWDGRGGEARGRPLPDRKGVVYDVAFSPDGRLLATAGVGSVRLWDVARGRPHAVLPDSTGTVYDVAFGRDGRLLATAGSGGLRLWDVTAVRPRGRPLPGHRSVATTVAFSADGAQLASAGSDGEVWLWDVASGRLHSQRLSPRHAGGVTALAFAPQGKLLASAGTDAIVRLWDVASGRQRARLAGHAGPVVALAFSADGTELAAADTTKTTRVWSVVEDVAGKPLSGHTDKVNQVAFSPDGTLLASASNDRTVRLWDVVTRRAYGAPLAGHSGAVTALAFSPHGRHVASGGTDATVRLWDAATQPPRGRPLVGDVGVVSGLAFTPDGRLLAAAGRDGSVQLWRVANRTRQGRPLRGQTKGPAYDVAFSPDGDLLAVANADGNVRLWEVDTARLQRTLAGRQDAVVAVAFSPDGRWLASAGADRTVWLWDLSNGTPRGRPLDGHTGRVSGVAFSPDGTVLASTAGDGVGLVRLWSVPDGAPRSHPLISQTGVVWDVAFSPDADRQLLALARWDTTTTIRLWDLNPSSWVDDGCLLVKRNLSRDEWDQYVTPFTADLESGRNLWSTFVGLFVRDITYERTCPHLDAGDGAPRDAPAARYWSNR